MLSLTDQSSSRASSPLRCAGRTVALGAIFLCGAAATHAGSCSDNAVQDPVAVCVGVAPRSYLDAERASELAPEESEIWTDGAPWIAHAATAAPASGPVAVNPAAGGASLRASFGQLRDYNAKLVAAKIEAAKSAAPAGVSGVTAPRAPTSPLDVWTAFDVQGLEGDSGYATRAGVGADYRVTSQTTVGIVAERTETDAALQAKEDNKFAAYMAFRAAPALTVGARTEWESATPALGDGAAEKSSISVAPRLGKSFALRQGGTIEPFLTYQRKVDIGDAGAGAAHGVATTQSAGAGVTYAKPDAYSLSVTTDIEGVSSSETANVNGRLQLKLPIR